MTNLDTKDDKEAMVSEEAIIIPPENKPTNAQASYCVKTIQQADGDNHITVRGHTIVEQTENS